MWNGGIAPFLTVILYEGEWSVSRPGSPNPIRDSGTQLVGRMVEPQSQPYRSGEEKKYIPLWEILSHSTLDLSIIHNHWAASRYTTYLSKILLWYTSNFLCDTLYNKSRDSAVVIATGYGLEGRWVADRVLARARLFFFPRCPDRFRVPPRFLSSGYRRLSPQE
jgi:hypothetical protein